MLSKILAAALLVVSLAACGQPAPKEETGAGAPDAAELEAPSLPAGAEQVTGPTALPPIEPGVYRNGNLAMRIEMARLTHTRDNSLRVLLGATMTISFFNTGQEPMAIILPTRFDSMDLALDNGLTLTPSRGVNHRNDLGLAACTRDTATCRTTNADAYTQLAPGASVSLNFVLRDMYGPNDPNLPTLPSVQNGNLAMRLHVIEGGADRIVQASFLNTQLQNGVRL